MTGRVATRLAGTVDAAAVAALVTEAYTPYVERMGRPPGPMLADYAEVVARQHTWVAEDDRNELVGVLVLAPADDHLLIESVAVRSSARGQGVCRLLLDLAEDQAATLERPEIRLYTNELMTESLSYYPRQGYVETHRATENGYRRVFFTKVMVRRRRAARQTWRRSAILALWLPSRSGRSLRRRTRSSGDGLAAGGSRSRRICATRSSR